MNDITLQQVYEGLGAQISNVTEEIVDLKKTVNSLAYRVGSIESGLNEFTLEDGVDQAGQRRTVKQPRQQIVQQAYDYVKAGGILDQRFAGVMLELKNDVREIEDRFDETEEMISKRIAECLRNHNPEREFSKREKKAELMWKWGQRFIMFIGLLLLLLTYLRYEK